MCTKEIRVFKMRTFFNGILYSFPEPVDGKIHTQQFLDASKSVVSVIGKFTTLMRVPWAYVSRLRRHISSKIPNDTLVNVEIFFMCIFSTAVCGVLPQRVGQRP